MKSCLFLIIMTGSLYQVSGQTQPGKILTRIQTGTIRCTTEKPVAYYLNTAKVIIHTGNDSKEQLSGVTLQSTSGGGSYQISDKEESQLFNDLPNNGSTYEFKANASVGLNLQNVYSPEYRWNETLLSLIEQQELKLTIVYDPNFFTDAWTISRVTLILNFKDISGSPHPVLSNKEVLLLTLQSC